MPQPTIDSEVWEILRHLQVELFEVVGDEFAPKVEKGSNERQRLLALLATAYPLFAEAAPTITNLIAQEANKAYEKGKSDKAWEQIEASSDAINVAARLNELNRLENVKVSHPDPTSQLIAIMVYLKERRKELAQLTADKEHNGKLSEME